MTDRTRRAVLGGLAAAPLTLWTPPLRAVETDQREAVDVALILLVDGSASITKTTLDFQLQGHAAAFRSPAVAQAIADGQMGRVAVMLAEFAGPGTFITLIDWTRVASASDAAAFATALDQVPGVALGGATALGHAVVDAVARFESCPFRPEKRTVDVVSNGFNNAGLHPLTARSHAAAAGVTVNALAILDEYDWLEAYYQDQVIAGEGAFVRTAVGMESFAQTFLAKLVSEVS